MTHMLACYACHPEASRGRRHAEAPPVNRSEYQRDRDRIIHAKAFRRLEYKTQVFVNHEGDLFRTRLTHSLEVAQIARTLARSLRVNEDLIEAIALAHDLGHTPFGHAGQEALNACLRETQLSETANDASASAPTCASEPSGFEHNLQSLRVVDTLETRYAAFDGLNLCFETREGILKHCSPAHARTLGEVGERFLRRTQPSLEAQLANLADEIAYNNHDIDDGLRSGLLTLTQLQEVDLVARHHAAVLREHPGLAPRRAMSETIRRMISTLILDLTTNTATRIADLAPADVDAVRLAPPLAAFSEPVRREADALKQFLLHNLYRHYQVMRTAVKAQRIVQDLYQAFLATPQLLPPRWRTAHHASQPRAIADYIAGMTDRYAIREHQRLFSVATLD